MKKKMIRIPNLYLLSILLSIIAVLLIRFTSVNYVIVIFILGLTGFLPNIWIMNYHGKKVALYLKAIKPDEYKKYKSSIKVKDINLLSSRVLNDKELLSQLNYENRYLLNKYIQAKRNIPVSFLVCLTAAIISAFVKQ